MQNSTTIKLFHVEQKRGKTMTKSQMNKLRIVIFASMRYLVVNEISRWYLDCADNYEEALEMMRKYEAVDEDNKNNWISGYSVYSTIKCPIDIVSLDILIHNKVRVYAYYNDMCECDRKDLEKFCIDYFHKKFDLQ